MAGGAARAHEGSTLFGKRHEPWSVAEYYQSSVRTFTCDVCLVQLVREFTKLCNQQHSPVLGCLHVPPLCLLAVAPVPPAPATPDRRSERIRPFWTLDVSPNGITRCGVSRLRLSPSGVLPGPGDTPLPGGRGGTLSRWTPHCAPFIRFQSLASVNKAALSILLSPAADKGAVPFERVLETQISGSRGELVSELAKGRPNRFPEQRPPFPFPPPASVSARASPHCCQR